jgi:hypothetical protein
MDENSVMLYKRRNQKGGCHYDLEIKKRKIEEDTV